MYNIIIRYFRCILDSHCGELQYDNAAVYMLSSLLGDEGAVVSCLDGYGFLTNISFYRAQCIVNSHGSVQWHVAHIPTCKGNISECIKLIIEVIQVPASVSLW